MKTLEPAALLVLLVCTCASVSASSFCLTVTTDKSSYRRGEPVCISGNLTYNGWPVQSQLVAIKVQNPQNETLFIASRSTDSVGAYNLTFRLSNLTELGMYTVYVNHQSVSNCTTFKVNVLGDVNGDGVVDLRDIYQVALAYGSFAPDYLYPGSPAHPRWDSACDINNDNAVDQRDYYIVCLNFGKASL